MIDIHNHKISLQGRDTARRNERAPRNRNHKYWVLGVPGSWNVCRDDAVSALLTIDIALNSKLF
ncbi:hypothetical protein CY34DRAFT_573463 [Suillus luteus UH-Slu-Lm8-n1]|uniref:Uncharacterized protein n=1 Tax=Suillus luteus UH-Slu-Lm8-n1 TaxID=930992 RepID=A0A0D0BG16_9AGAM|nr:hypothetical protein CY34DRAFT_573463 [Suillus luteus UH-Slu-Lm8-n1]